MSVEMETPPSPSGANSIRRSLFARILHRSAVVLRATLALVLALVSLVAGVAWVANTPFPLALLQTVGIADTGELHGVTWEVTLPSEDAFASLWIRVRDQNVHFSWHRMHQEDRGSSTRYFWAPPWPAGIQTGTLRTPQIVPQPDGTSVKYKSSSVVFFEAPLWGVSLISAPYPIVALWRGPIRRRKRRRKGWCLECGYDLEGNVSGICPECAQPAPERSHTGVDGSR